MNIVGLYFFASDIDTFLDLGQEILKQLIDIFHSIVLCSGHYISKLMDKHATHFSVGVLKYFKFNIFPFTTDRKLLKSEINSLCNLVYI